MRTAVSDVGMGIRDATGQSPLLTAFVVGVGAWLAVVWVRTFNNIDSLWAASEGVGQTAASGIVGLAVMLGVLVFMFVLFGELEESEPGPEPWVPEEER